MHPQQRILFQVKVQFSEDERTEGTHWSNQLVPRDALHVAPYRCSKENRTHVSYLPLKTFFTNLNHISKTTTKTNHIYLIFNACCSFFRGGESGGVRDYQFCRQFIQVQSLLRSLRSNSGDIKPTFFLYWSPWK